MSSHNLPFLFFIQIRIILGNPDCSGGSTWLLADWDPDDMVDLFSYDWKSWDDDDDLKHKNETKKTAKTTTPPSKASTTTAVWDYENESKKPEKIHIPKLDVPKPIFIIMDTAVNAIFTVDFLLRIFSCTSLRLYFLSVINVLDALALLATYIYVIIVSVESKYKYEKTALLLFLDFAQVFRTLRLFRVVKNVRASKVLAYSLSRDIRDMSLLVTLLFVGVTTFAYLIFFAEKKDTVVSVPHAWYWAIVTMTTVGYGDISPRTGLGRFFASLCAVSGVLLLSITLPMFVNNFLTLYQYSCVNESLENRKKSKEHKIKTEKIKCKEIDDGGKVCDHSENDRPPSYKTPRKSRDELI